MNNLPIPQSRSEELMNAFIQRDSSQISTPQSRIEEFWYHLIEGTNSLPIPQSRNELLLKKIIENDTHQIPLAQSRTEEFLVSILTGDINKLPIPQSRSEYYLDYIARNNLLLNDIDYVRYSGTNITATNTVQKPFRSAILKGKTLVNIKGEETKEFSFGTTKQHTDLLLNGAKDNTRYLILYDLTITDTVKIGILKKISNDSTTVEWASSTENYDAYSKGKLILNTTTNTVALRIISSENNSFVINNLAIIEYQDGMENWDIPYFEGMQSVKLPVLTTTGKNLFDMKNSNFITEKDGNYYPSANIDLSDTYTLLPNTTYTISGIFDGWGKCFINGVNLGNFNSSGRRVAKKFTTDSTGVTTIYFGANNNNDTSKPCYDFQLEIGDAFTTYEPYKSNILTVNEPIELRGVGEVRDELNVMTGELTQRIGEVVLNGNERWWFANSSDNPENPGTWTHSENTWLLGVDFTTITSNTRPVKNTISDKYPVYYICDFSDSEYFNILSDNNALLFRVRKDRFSDKSIVNFKSWLSQNPITIQYQFTTESVKTVDLKVVNQDGNQVKELSAFDGTTYIVSGSASDNSLIAITEVEVPTKLIEVLDGVKSLSSDVEILINEVDNTQKLQDENSTMAMSAMTELYEMILMMGGND